MPDASTLLDACDDGTLRRAAERGPWLVDRLRLAPAGVAAADLTVGACDLLLVELRHQLFGPTLEAVGTCPGCATEIECRIDIDELWPDRRGPVHQSGTAVVEVEVVGQRFRCRVPSNRDLTDLARIEPAHRSAGFVERCVLDSSRTDGSSEGPAGPMPTDEVVAALATALAEQDPGAATLVELRCMCGATRVDELDIRSFLWTELTVWAERILTEVHQLASAYGWREPDILALRPRRRRAYLDRCGW